MKKVIYIGMPSGGHLSLEAARGLFTSTARTEYEIMPVAFSYSALASCFNHLWSRAIAASPEKVTHFAMLHSDVGPECGWLDTLMDELEAKKLDMVSAVIPIKSQDGLTSTAVGEIKDPWKQKRLTMREVSELPPTFTDDDLVEWKKKHKREDSKLLLNTGCWLADLKNDTWRQMSDEGELRFFFRTLDRIRVTDDNLEVDFAPEDWLFSRECQAAGLKIGATSKVKLKHFGAMGWDNQGVWGNLEEDRVP